MMALLRINAPWTAEQVAALNRFQTAGFVHPFTCPGGYELIATEAGWTCSHCDYRQAWAFEAMLEEPRSVFTRPAQPPDAYDPECYHLAEHFLTSGGATPANTLHLRALAAFIQGAVEEWISVHQPKAEGGDP